MSDTPIPPTPAKPRVSRHTVIDLLEHGDGLAHVLVGVMLLLLAVGVLVNSTVVFIRELGTVAGGKEFAQTALNYLSGVLLGVIILELLSTILTYMRARRLEATVKDFLIVGLISSVRKILLVGAQSSIEKINGPDFVQEAWGTVVSIVGILLLIGGLLLLDRRNKMVSATGGEGEEEHDSAGGEH
jgi:uncharacterized membrane protein (DUF373 family)